MKMKKKKPTPSQSTKTAAQPNNKQLKQFYQEI